MGRQVNIVAGRATRADGATQVVAYVGKRVASPAARLDHFLMHQGVKTDERVTVVGLRGSKDQFFGDSPQEGHGSLHTCLCALH
jgi:hypothetical protein